MAPRPAGRPPAGQPRSCNLLPSRTTNDRPCARRCPQRRKVTRERDELSRLCRGLTREPVEKAYVFDGPRGEESLRVPFTSRSQFIVYHFTFDPELDEGCI